jgi:hypothetical protein
VDQSNAATGIWSAIGGVIMAFGLGAWAVWTEFSKWRDRRIEKEDAEIDDREDSFMDRQERRIAELEAKIETWEGRAPR